MWWGVAYYCPVHWPPLCFNVSSIWSWYMFCGPSLFHLAWFMDADFRLTFWCFQLTLLRAIWLIISSVSVSLLEPQGVALWQLKSLPREMTGPTLKAVGVAVLCWDIFSGLQGCFWCESVWNGAPSSPPPLNYFLIHHVSLSVFLSLRYFH